MIRIKKSKKPPKVMVYQEKKFTVDGVKVTTAERETLRAINFYEKNKGKKVKFSVYSNEEVKDKLIEIFNEKCAYCETSIRRAAKGDVEHYRPKGRIETSDGGKLSPGYYWLAADWDNLLLSCGNCNQKGRFRLNEDGEKVPMGKGDKFPLSDETKRIRSRDKNLSDERRFVLLLNPCKSDPSKHLTFNDEGEILPQNSSNGRASKVGEHSIMIYGLHRVELVKERKKLNNQLSILVKKIYNKLKFLEEDPNLKSTVKDLLIQDLEDDVILLRDSFDVTAEFLGSKKQKLKRITAEFPALQSKFLDYGIEIDEMQK